MARLIPCALADSIGEPCEELQQEKILPTARVELTISRLLDWRSNQLCHPIVLTVDI